LEADRLLVLHPSRLKKHVPLFDEDGNRIRGKEKKD